MGCPSRVHVLGSNLSVSPSGSLGVVQSSGTSNYVSLAQKWLLLGHQHSKDVSDPNRILIRPLKFERARGAPPTKNMSGVSTLHPSSRGRVVVPSLNGVPLYWARRWSSCQRSVQSLKASQERSVLGIVYGRRRNLLTTLTLRKAFVISDIRMRLYSSMWGLSRGIDAMVNSSEGAIINTW